jgi:hypothetical protein
MTDVGDDRPIDLTALDPTQPALAFELRMARINRAARAELRRRRGERDAFSLVARWRLPLAAAMVLMILSSAMILRYASSDPAGELAADVAESTSAVGTTDDVATALGVSTTAGAWLQEPSTSSTEALLVGGIGR